MKRTAAALVLAGALLVPLTACSSDSDSGDGTVSVEDMIEAFEAEGAPPEEAECVANELDGQGITQEQLDSFTSSEELAELDPEFSDKFFAAAAECGLN